MAPYDFSDKVFFVTGGAQGLGKEIIEAVLTKGSKVYFVDIQNEKGAKTLEDFRKRFGPEKIAFSHVDVTNKEYLEEAYSKATQTFGYVDVLLNNAGVIDEINTKQVVDVNFLGVVFGTEIATARMRKDKGGKGGRIINMSSIAGINYFYQMPVYNATKHAVRVYSTSLSQNPNNEQWGLEFASLHPDASTIGLFPNILDKGIHQAAEILASYKGHHVSPEAIIEAFVELVSLEKMNGATLLVRKNQKAFMKVESSVVGESFPPAQ